ncbi:MAG: hypothetical protein ACLP59_19935 [Bryobacteraceae bacterium]
MKYRLLPPLTLTAMSSLSQPSWAQEGASKTKHYLYTNDRQSVNTSSVFEIHGTATSPQPLTLETGGNGSAGVSPAAKMVIATNVGTEGCFYVANPGSNNITAFAVTGNQCVGKYGTAENLNGMASNGSSLYAATGGDFNENQGIATFQISAGCGLTLTGNVDASGLPNGMAAHGNLLVVTYGNGYIESFTNTAGVLSSNGDLEYTAGKDHTPVLTPESVDISQNGQFAIFGDDGSTTAIEISDISSGKLTPTVLHDKLGAGLNANDIMLSPNDDLLYVANTGPATITGLRFNQTTGTVSLSCISSTLNGTDVVAEGLALYLTTGTGSVLVRG